MLDSLASRPDTARFAADSLRLDSLAAAGADKDTQLDTRIDSVRDNVNSGGGAGGMVTLTIGLTGSGASFTGSKADGDSLLQAALDSIGVLGGGSAAFFGMGWELAATVYVQCDYTTITGADPNTAGVLLTADSALGIKDTIGVDHLTLSNLSVAGTDTSFAILTLMAGSDSGLVQNCRISNFGKTGSRIISAATTSNHWTVRNNVVADCRQFEHRGRAVRIEGNLIVRPGDIGIRTGLEHVVIQNNVIIDGDSIGIACDEDLSGAFNGSYTSSSVIAGNTITYPDTATSHIGIFIIDGTVTGGRDRISDNIIVGAHNVLAGKGQGIRLEGNGREFLSGNIIRSFATGINVTTVGNTITECTLEFCAAGVTLAGNDNNVTGTFRYNAVGLNVASGTKNGYNIVADGNGTNVSNSGTGTVAGFTAGVMNLD